VNEDLDRQLGLTSDPAISSSDSSRARMTREQPSSPASRTPSALVIDIWSRRGSPGRASSADQAGQAEVLDDDGVDARLDQVAERLFQAGQLAGKTSVLSVT